MVWCLNEIVDSQKVGVFANLNDLVEKWASNENGIDLKMVGEISSDLSNCNYLISNTASSMK